MVFYSFYFILLYIVGKNFFLLINASKLEAAGADAIQNVDPLAFLLYPGSICVCIYIYNNNNKINFIYLYMYIFSSEHDDV